jgi:hypothetical protein
MFWLSIRPRSKELEELPQACEFTMSRRPSRSQFLRWAVILGLRELEGKSFSMNLLYHSVFSITEGVDGLTLP